jgi:CDP-glucose 4,6-dehydratase
MENLVKEDKMFGIYQNKKVLITGAFGFKGSWLCYWLNRLGANVYGYSLYPPGKLHHFDLLNTPIEKVEADINDYLLLKKKIDEFRPDIIFHLAAQPLVRYSYQNTIETYQTNVMGTAYLLEACRTQTSIKGVVCVTSDKCYENNEREHRYVEADPMGGYDPYSSSKGCAELVISAYRNSFFNPQKFGSLHGCLVSSVRAGNVIGGGDWREDRLIPDMIKAASVKQKVVVRKPHAIRPWQHVLEPISGYLSLGAKLLEGLPLFATSWNFGPRENEVMTVQQVLDIASAEWREIKYEIKPDESLHEANLLMLDCSKASNILDWKPIWDTTTAIQKTIQWYKAYYNDRNILTTNQTTDYIKYFQ